MPPKRRPASARAVSVGATALAAGSRSVPAGDTRPGDVVEHDGRRLYVAAHLAGRVALEPLAPGGRRGGLSGSSVWVEPDEPVTLVESFQSAPGGGGEVDPLRSAS